MTDDRVLVERLERFLAARLPDVDRVRIVEFERSTEGFSQETFAFDAELTRAAVTERRGWVIKRQPVAGLLEPYDLEPEFRVLHALSDDPLPSPPTPWFVQDPTVLERPFYVMAKLPGEAPVPAPGPDGTGPFTDAERAVLAPAVVGTLAALHALDWRARGLEFLGAPRAGRDAAMREVTRWRTRIERSRFPTHPALAEALWWLERNVPRTEECTIVHGDYRLGNFLIVRDGLGARLTGLLDWEMVHLGDPLEDLAWFASPMWRAGTPHASGLLPPEELAAAYAAAAERPVDPERLRFWDLLAVVKMIAIMLTGLRAFRDGRTTDLRMAIFDHQVPYLHLLLGTSRGWLTGGL